MKQLTCEMCGSTDLMKQDGVFVCQTCGCKYSVEEAKKMMVEGTVEVQGTVTVDNERKIENLRTLADRARETGDSKTAAQYYGQLLLEDPDDWAANFYSVYYDAHNIKIAEIGSAATRVGSVLDPVFQLIIKERDQAISQLEDPSQEPEATLKLAIETKALLAKKIIIDDVTGFANMLLSNITSNMGNTMESRNRAMREWASPVGTMMISLGDCLIKYFDDYASAKQLYEAISQTNSGCREIARKRLNDIQDILRQKREKYWADHKEEREQLEAEQVKLCTEKDELVKQINALTAPMDDLKKQVQECRKAISVLQDKLEVTLFKKNKEALQTQIVAQIKQRLKLEKSMDEQTSAIKRHKNRIAEIDQRIKDIQIEFDTGC